MALPPRPAPADHPIHPLVRDRWSARAIAPRAVEPAMLATLLEAARWAPSSFNAQPWRYLVFDGRDPSARADAEAILTRGNAWARRAPVLMLSVVRETRDDGSPNRTAHHDVGLADQNLMLQGAALGLVVHAMAGFDVEQARARFAIPPDHAPLAMIAIGHPGDPAALDEKDRAREAARVRRPLAELVFAGRWGVPAGL